MLQLNSSLRIAWDKRALQTTWKFLFQQSEQVDIDRYRALGLDKDEILSLRRGECFVYSPQVIGFRISMRARRSPHLAHTPGLEQLLAHRRRLRPVEYVTSRSFTGQGETQQAHEELGEQVPTTETLPLTSTLRSTATRHTRPQTMLERALEMWNAGHQTVLEMAIALSTEQDRVPESEAYRLICQLDAKGLITRKTRKRT